MPSSWTTTSRTWLGALGALGVAGALFWVAGPVGLGLGLAIAGLWALIPGPYAVAAAHVCLSAVLPDLGLAGLIGVEVGLLAVLVAPDVRRARWTEMLVAVGLLGLSLGVVAWVGWLRWHPRWLVGLTLVGAVSLGVYAVHRYATVKLELHGVEPLR